MIRSAPTGAIQDGPDHSSRRRRCPVDREQGRRPRRRQRQADLPGEARPLL